MDFTWLLLSSVWLSLPERITFFYVTLIFPRRKLPARQRWMLGLLDTQDIRSYAWEYQNTPTAPESFGKGLLCPLLPIILPQKIRESNSIQQLMGKSKLLLFPWNGRHPEMLPVAEGTRAHGEGRDSGAIWDVHVGFVTLCLQLQILICIWVNIYPLRVAKCTAPQHAVTRLHLGQEKGRNAECWSRVEGTVHSPLYKTCG